MAKVLEFRRRTQSQSRASKAQNPISFSDVEESIRQDTSRLATALNITNEEAVEVAARFYRSYPMLIESIRTSVGGM